MCHIYDTYETLHGIASQSGNSLGRADVHQAGRQEEQAVNVQAGDPAAVRRGNSLEVTGMKDEIMMICIGRNWLQKARKPRAP